jgi:exosortase/archaeosortase family protein
MIVALVLAVLTLMVFWPALRWLATQTFAREQLQQSFVIVLAAGIWIAWEKRRQLRLDLQLSTATILWVLVAYLFAAAAIFAKNPLLLLTGVVAAAGGLVSYFFGAQALRRTVPLLAVVAVLILCVLLFPRLDWPLRQMAGIEAAKVLKALGLAPQLVIWFADPPPKLVLTTGKQAFIVATECNGFGLITSGLLLGLIRLLYRHARWPAYVLLLPLCLVTGFVFNLLRITTIVLLAPYFPGHYPALHETAGYLALYTGIAVVWYLTGRPARGAPAIS